MTNQNFTTTFSVNRTPEEVFEAINNFRGWWSEEIEGTTDKLGAEFTHRYEDVHRCKMKMIRIRPRQKSRLAGFGQLFNFTEDKTASRRTPRLFSKSLNEMVSFLASYGSEKALKVAQDLDSKVEALLAAVAA